MYSCTWPVVWVTLPPAQHAVVCFFSLVRLFLFHYRLLDEIDEEMDSTSEKLKRTIAKVDTVLAISKGKVT